MKITLAILGLAVAALLGCRAGGAEPGSPPDGERWIAAAAFQRGDARVEEARSRDLPRAIVTGGRIAFDDTRLAHVFSPVTGRVSRLLAQPGQVVPKGAPLATIASPDVGSAFSDEVKARADLEAAEHDYQRQKQLFAEQAASSRDFETAEDTWRKAQAEEQRALQRLRLLSNGKIDAVTQEYTLPSPIAGRVVARNVNPGVEVQGQYAGGTAAELFTVGDTDVVWLYADVAEADLPGLAPGEAVSLRVLAYPERAFAGNVEWISPTLDPALRTGRVRCAIHNPEGLLKPEMFATVSIERPAAHGLAIPRAAVVRIEDQSFVYVAAGTRADGREVFRRRRVQLPERAGPPQRRPGAEAFLPVERLGAELVRVLDGLLPGERVLVEERRPGQRDPDEVVLTKEQLAKIASAPAEPRPVPAAVTVGGRLTFDDLLVSHVFSPVNGRLSRLLAAPGDHVKKGAPLAVILSPDVGSAFSDELKARADLTAAEHERKRQREMFAVHASAARDLEAAEDNYDRALAEYQRTELKTRLLRQNGSGAVSQEYVLRSPIEGDVVARSANPGLEVQGQYSGASNAPELFTVGRAGQVWMLGDLYEVDLPYVQPGAEVEFRSPVFPDRVFRGKVDWISDAIDPVQRTAKVRCVLANADGLLRPETYGVASISAPARRVLTVPREALLRSGDDTVVFVESSRGKDGSRAFRRRRVIADEQLSGDLVPVLAGLSPGDRVVARGSIFLFGSF